MALDKQAEDLVQQTVLQYVANNTMFTAYDVTMEVRKQGAFAKHGDVRDVVHQLFQTGVLGAAWQRSVVDIGTSGKPFVYHRFSDDPRNYTSPSNDTSAKPAAPQASSSKPGLVSRIVTSIFGNQPQDGGGNAGIGGAQIPSPPSYQPPRQRDPVTLDLDASDYLPIARDDLLKQAKGTNVWASPWFGRRDLIPPVDDDRTKLIDRAMITQGILSAEQLVEIHRVGAEMDKHRPQKLLIEQKSRKAGQAAVDEDRQRKAEEKKKKKEEAEARKEARRKEIADRKANDIVFLGRNVSGHLGLRDSDAAKLQATGLPVMSTPADVAKALSLSVPELRWLAFHNDVASRTHYVSFTIPKKSGGERVLSAPHQKLATAQQWILAEILNKLPTQECAHGFILGRNILTNAMPHVGQDVVVNMDLENFFPGITFPRVRKMFHGIGYSPAVATVLALLCTECPRRRVTFAGEPWLVATGPRGLPQGACTSPAISNQVAIRLDRRLQGLAGKLGINCTRYADDITFSGGEALSSRVAYVMACVRHIADDLGFAVNEKKSRVLRRNTAQVVTGLVVNEKPSVSRKKLRQLRSILHHARTEGLQSQNRDGHSNFRSYMQGYISFVSMTRPEVAARLMGQLDSVRD